MTTTVASTAAAAAAQSPQHRLDAVEQRIEDLWLKLTTGDVPVARALGLSCGPAEGPPAVDDLVLVGAVRRLAKAVELAGKETHWVFNELQGITGELSRQEIDRGTPATGHLVEDPGVRAIERLFWRVADFLNRLALAQPVLDEGCPDEIDAALQMVLHDAKAVRGALLDAGVVEAGADGSRCVVANAGGVWRLLEGVAKGAA